MKNLKKLFRNFVKEYKTITRVTDNLEEYHAMEEMYYRIGMM